MFRLAPRRSERVSSIQCIVCDQRETDMKVYEKYRRRRREDVRNGLWRELVNE